MIRGIRKMKNNSENNDETELSLNQLHQFIEQTHEYEIEDLQSFIEELNSVEEREIEEIEHLELCELMKKYLNDRDYEISFTYASELSGIDYGRFKDDIDTCIQKCAENKVEKAAIFLVEKNFIYGAKKIEPNDFSYLKFLAHIGYINSFQWLGDCYYYGIGCKKNRNKASQLYFEGLLFGDNKYCRIRFSELCSENEFLNRMDFNSDIFQRLLSTNDYCFEEARVMIANLILEDKIKEYYPSSAYAILKNHNYRYDGFSYYLLGKCLLDGIGTNPDPYIASILLDDAQYDLEDLINEKREYFWVEEILNISILTKQDLRDVYNQIIHLLDEINRRKMKDFDTNGSVLNMQSLESWKEERVLFIERIHHS